MGNSNSRSKKDRDSIISKIPNYELEKLDEEDLSYFLSNNISDIDRQHMHHFFKRYLFQGNFASPIEDKLIQGGFKVLDVGCGPGTWLLDLSNKYPTSSFLGIDLEPIFPYEIKPKNLEFIESDILNGLPFSDNELDFVHMEQMSFILTNEQWDFVLSELVRITKPGGYIEMAESCSNFNNEGPIVRKLSEGLHIICLKRNVDIDLASSLDSKLKLQPNITDVHRIEKKTFMGPESGKLGSVCQDIFVSFFSTEIACEILSGLLEISAEQYRDMIENDLIEELKQTNVQGYIVRFWAQKD